MTDIFDRASAQETAERERLIADVLRWDRYGESATHCADCDEPIPQARRDACPGVTRCIDCQHEKERRR